MPKYGAWVPPQAGATAARNIPIYKLRSFLRCLCIHTGGALVARSERHAHAPTRVDKEEWKAGAWLQSLCSHTHTHTHTTGALNQHNPLPSHKKRAGHCRPLCPSRRPSGRGGVRAWAEGRSRLPMRLPLSALFLPPPTATSVARWTVSASPPKKGQTDGNKTGPNARNHVLTLTPQTTLNV